MEFLYTDRSERTLENLLIWWSKLPCYPVMSSHPLDDNYEGNYEHILPYGLHSASHVMPRKDDCQIPIHFIDFVNNTDTFMEPGDKLVYDHDSLTITLVRK